MGKKGSGVNGEREGGKWSLVVEKEKSLRRFPFRAGKQERTFLFRKRKVHGQLNTWL